MISVELVAARALSPLVRELSFAPHALLPFVPGQWIPLIFSEQDADGTPIKRSYSIASAPRSDGRLDVAVTFVREDSASGILHAMPLGAQLKTTHAQGFFTIADDSRPMLFVATGTGVAPFRSMLQRLVIEPPGERVVLLFGCRTPADLLYFKEFSELQATHSWFRLVPTLSRAGDEWHGARGHVQEHLEPLLTELGGDADTYICGLSKMVREVRTLVRQRLGFAKERVHYELYD
jgi:ferredoxin-NADP reductase